MDAKKAGAGAAAVLALAGAGVVKSSDEVGRMLGIASHEVHPPPRVPIRPRTPEVPLPSPSSAAAIESQIDSFAATVADSEAAREAAVSASCEVLYIAWLEQRIPDGDEWVSIAVDALDAAFLDVPVGSGAWRELEGVKEEVADAVSDELGYVDDGESESMAQELACVWA